MLTIGDWNVTELDLTGEFRPSNRSGRERRVLLFLLTFLSELLGICREKGALSERTVLAALSRSASDTPKVRLWFFNLPLSMSWL